jgi:hypothetical protein
MQRAGNTLQSTPAEAKGRAVLSMLAEEPGIIYALMNDTKLNRMP